MILRHTATIQQRSEVLGSEGEKTYTYSTFKTIQCDVQPASLAPHDAERWGISDLMTGAKNMFYYIDKSILPLMRVVFDGETYEIRNTNHWSGHTEAIITPVQGL